MARTPINVSFDNETMPIVEEIIKKDRGLLSEICRRAVKEWKGFDLSPEELKVKISKTELEMNETKTQLDFYKKKLAECLNNERSKTEAKILTAEENKKKMEKDNFDKRVERYVDFALTTYKELDKKVIEKYALEFAIDGCLRGKFKHNFNEFLIFNGLNTKEGRFLKNE